MDIDLLGAYIGIATQEIKSILTANRDVGLGWVVWYAPKVSGRYGQLSNHVLSLLKRHLRLLPASGAGGKVWMLHDADSRWLLAQCGHPHALDCASMDSAEWVPVVCLGDDDLGAVFVSIASCTPTPGTESRLRAVVPLRTY